MNKIFLINVVAEFLWMIYLQWQWWMSLWKWNISSDSSGWVSANESFLMEVVAEFLKMKYFQWQWWLISREWDIFSGSGGWIFAVEIFLVELVAEFLRMTYFPAVIAISSLIYYKYDQHLSKHSWLQMSKCIDDNWKNVPSHYVLWNTM